MCLQRGRRGGIRRVERRAFDMERTSQKKGRVRWRKPLEDSLPRLRTRLLTQKGVAC